MGDESRANSYRCDACGEVFSREEGESLRRVSTEITKDTIARS
jgi:transposase-like protein